MGTRVRRAGAEAPARGRVRAGAVTGFVSDAIAMQLTKPNVTAPASRMEDYKLTNILRVSTFTADNRLLSCRCCFVLVPASVPASSAAVAQPPGFGSR